MESTNEKDYLKDLVRNTTVLFVVLLLAMAFARRVHGGTPPPSPRSTASPAEALSDSDVIVVARGPDSVLVHRTCAIYRRRSFGSLNGPDEHTMFYLANGTELRVDGASAGGMYALDGGDTLFVPNDQGYPRSYSIIGPERTTYRFEVRSGRGIAILIQRGRAAPPDSLTLSALLQAPSLVRAYSPRDLDRESETQLVLVPGSWYLAGELVLPSGWSSGATVTFCVYGPELAERRASPTERVEMLGPYTLGVTSPGTAAPSPSEALLRSPNRAQLGAAKCLGSSLYLPGSSGSSPVLLGHH